MKNQISAYALLAIASASLMSSCSKETDLYDSSLAQKEFEQNWTKTYGEVAADQDWNLATQVTANVDMSAFSGASVVEIYDMMPASGGVLMAKVSESKSQKLDVKKSTNYVYAVAKDKKGNILNSYYYPLENGVINVGAVSTKSGTRSASDVSIAETLTWGGETKETRVADDTYNLEAAKALNDTKYVYYVSSSEGANGKKNYEFKDINDKIVKISTYYLPGDLKNQGYEYWGGIPTNQGLYENNNQRLVKTTTAKNTFASLSGVEHEAGSQWSAADLYPLFGKGGYYEEQRTPSCLEEYQKDFEPDVTFTVTGEVTLDYIYGCTEHNNNFGYYYWKDGEDPMQATRYILIADARPSSNITTSGYVTYTSSTNKTEMNGSLGDKGGEGIFVSNSENINQSCLTNLVLQGTKYKVPYFDANNKASYTFPTGTHIAFFVGVWQQGKALTKENYCGNDGNPININFSVQSHNYQINRKFTGYSRDSYTVVDDTKGEIDAISFKYDNKTFLSFEDRGADKDMNDVVFLVNGLSPDNTVIPEPTTPVNPDPSTPVVPTPTETKAQSWIIACEDLGSSDDTDFNDVVFEVSHVAGEKTATITPLAAGGTLKAEIYSGETLIGEIHEMLGNSTTDANGNYSMLNTSNGKSGYYVVDRDNLPYSANAQTVTLGVDPDNFTMSNVANGNNMGGFKIKVTKNGTTNEAITINSPTTGSIPQMLCLPADWAWPTERTRIETAYPEFLNWVGDTSVTKWCESPAPTSSSSAE